MIAQNSFLSSYAMKMPFSTQQVGCMFSAVAVTMVVTMVAVMIGVTMAVMVAVMVLVKVAVMMAVMVIGPMAVFMAPTWAGLFLGHFPQYLRLLGAERLQSAQLLCQLCVGQGQVHPAARHNTTQHNTTQLRHVTNLLLQGHTCHVSLGIFNVFYWGEY